MQRCPIVRKVRIFLRLSLISGGLILVLGDYRVLELLNHLKLL